MKSIMQDENERRCYSCGLYLPAGYREEHHIFGGANRKWSEKYGLKIDLCGVCHRDNKRGVHGQNTELRGRLHREGQEAFERVHGSREDFMKIFGKNYL